MGKRGALGSPSMDLVPKNIKVLFPKVGALKRRVKVAMFHQ
jgi:hypothetical protein